MEDPSSPGAQAEVHSVAVVTGAVGSMWAEGGDGCSVRCSPPCGQGGQPRGSVVPGARLRGQHARPRPGARQTAALSFTCLNVFTFLNGRRKSKGCGFHTSASMVWSHGNTGRPVRFRPVHGCFAAIEVAVCPPLPSPALKTLAPQVGVSSPQALPVPSLREACLLGSVCTNLSPVESTGP